MDFHAAMETFAEAWVAANTQTAVSSGPGATKQASSGDAATMLSKDQPTEPTNDNNSDDSKDHNDNSQSDETGQRSECATPADSKGPPTPKGDPCASPVATTAPSPAVTPKTFPTTAKTPSPRKPESLQPGNSGRSLPVHCIIEQINGANSSDSTSPSCEACTVELDSYAILPASTPLRDLVRAALAKLGYSSADGSSAKGAVQLKNWKPLSFDVITDDKMATIDDILGELINSATLRIRLSSQPKLNSADEMKEKLLQLLLTQSHSLLLESGCPIEKTLLMAISKGDYSPNLPEELCMAFNTWYHNQIQKNKISNGHCCTNGQTSSSDSEDKEKSDNGSSGEMDVDRQPVLSDPKAILERKSSSLSSASTAMSSSSSQSSSQSFNPTSGHHHGQQHSNTQLQAQSPGTVLTPSKTRIRTSFDPEHEIPRLQKWFADNQHPTREQMVRFMNELNNLESRKGRRPLDLTNIIYWFKNARAAQRRASKALDDSFENEENVDVNGVPSGVGVPASPSEPLPVPYLPNKNAVYVIPFPYHSPHSAHQHHILSETMAEAYDEPCDLSIKKLRDTPAAIHAESRSTPNGRSRSEGLSQNGETNKTPASNSRKRSPIRGGYSVKTNGREDGSAHKSPSACNGFAENLTGRKSVQSAAKDMSTNGLEDARKYLQSHYGEIKDCDSSDPTSLTSSVKEELESDDDDSVHSDESEGGGRLKIQDGEDAIDYAGAHVRNGLAMTVGGGGMVMSAAESSAASMAALSLAQMSQPLHIPQLAPHLAMYYPMAPRYYPPPPSHHAQQSAAATAAMVAALSNSAHFSSKVSSSSSSSVTTTNVTTAGHPSGSNRPIPIQPAPHPPLSAPHGHPQGRGSEPRKRRTRVFIDPLTEIPKLEKWFLEDTHPSAYMIDKYTEALNAAEYRQKFPRLEPKNIQLWFKNHRAKVKRMRMGLEMEDTYCDSPPQHGQRNSPMPDGGSASREETGNSSPERTSSSSKNDDESSGGGCAGDNGNEEELMDEEAQ